jgi:hypothetical protein
MLYTMQPYTPVGLSGSFRGSPSYGARRRTPSRPRRGLSGLSFSYGGVTPVNMAAGVDQYSKSWVRVGTQYFYDVASLRSYQNTTYPVNSASAVLYDALKYLSLYNATMDQVVGNLRAMGVPFSAYVAPAPPPSPAPASVPIPVPTPTPAPLNAYAPPPGYSLLVPSMGIPPTWPVYAGPPSTVNGLTTITGASYGDFSQMGLNTQKLSLKLYAYKQTDLGAIRSPNGRTYELYSLNILDLSNNLPLGTFYGALEGGSAGLTIASISPTLYRAVTAAVTGGASEAVRAVDTTAGRQVSAVIGGAAVGGAAGFVTSGFNPAGAVAGAVSGGVQGVQAAIKGTTPDLGSVTLSGAIAGASITLGNLVKTADLHVAAFPQGSTLLKEPLTTIGAQTYGAAGSSTLPSSLSLIPSAARTAFTAPAVISGNLFPRPPGYAAYQSAGSTDLPPSLSLVQNTAVPPSPLPIPYIGPPVSFSPGPVSASPSGSVTDAFKKFLPDSTKKAGEELAGGVSVYKTYQALKNAPWQDQVGGPPSQDGGLYITGSPDQTVPPGGTAQEVPASKKGMALLGAAALAILLLHK